MPDRSQSLEAFRHYREKMNEAILEAGNLSINRFFALDTRTYEAGALDGKTKELLGLVASMAASGSSPISAQQPEIDFATEVMPILVEHCVEEGSFSRLSGGRRQGQEDRDSHFRKGLVGDWSNHFDDAARAAFEAAAGALLEQLGYRQSPAPAANG